MPERHAMQPDYERSKPYAQLLDGLLAESAADDDAGRALASRILFEELSSPHSLLREPIEMFSIVRQEYDVPEKLNLLHSNLIYFAALEGRDVPATEEENRLNIERFTKVFHAGRDHACDENGLALFSKIQEGLFWRELQTTMTSRYNIAEFVMQALHERYPEGVRVLDVGSSVGQGLKALAMKDRYGAMAFPPVSVLGDSGEQIDVDKTIAYNEMLDRPSYFQEGTGIDLEPPSNPDVLLWARSNLRHRERANQNFMASYDLFNEEWPVNVDFIRGDYTNPRTVASLLERWEGQKADLVLYNTVFYQLARLQMRSALDPIPHILSDNGVALLQDSIDITGPGLYDINLNTSKWSHWSAIAYDNAHPENGWQKIAESNKSRFETIRLGLGTLAIKGVQRTPAEWLNIV